MRQGTAQTPTCRLRPSTTSATRGQLYPAGTRARRYFSVVVSVAKRRQKRPHLLNGRKARVPRVREQNKSTVSSASPGRRDRAATSARSGSRTVNRRPQKQTRKRTGTRESVEGGPQLDAVSRRNSSKEDVVLLRDPRSWSLSSGAPVEAPLLEDEA